jgi:hypothetical protein
MSFIVRLWRHRAKLPATLRSLPLLTNSRSVILNFLSKKLQSQWRGNDFEGIFFIESKIFRSDFSFRSGFQDNIACISWAEAVRVQSVRRFLHDVSGHPWPLIQNLVLRRNGSFISCKISLILVSVNSSVLLKNLLVLDRALSSKMSSVHSCP